MSAARRLTGRMGWRLWVMVCLTLCLLLPWSLSRASGVAAADHCEPRVLSVQMAPDPEPLKSLDGAQASVKPYPPATGWQTVTLPHKWTTVEGDKVLTNWYRIDWAMNCPAAAQSQQQVAVSIGSVAMAGALYSNDGLLWSDVSLVEPLSASWNMPRWWLLPYATLHGGVNTLWLRVTGISQLQSGVGELILGSPTAMRERTERFVWRQRTSYLLTGALSAAVGCIFLVVFLMHRKERAFGWYALMSLLWVGYLTTVLSTDNWPFERALSMTRLNGALFVCYVACFCQFTWVFGEQRLPLVQKLLWVWAVLSCVVVLVMPADRVRSLLELVWYSAILVFLLNCLQFQWHAWHTRQPRHLLLAACWLVFIVVGVHDVLLVFGNWHTWRGGESLSSISGPIATVFMAVLLGSQLGSQMRKIAQFNDELKLKVDAAKHDLAQALEREHQQKLSHAKTQERLEIAHDLHDGLGASLVRSMAAVEQSEQPLPSQRVLSLFKVLRDDLRQVIDYGSSAGASVPDSPVTWMAPLRYRFTNILDDLDIASEWVVPQHWLVKPSALQCLALTRVVEEALSNIIKHSRARHVRVSCDTSDENRLVLRIADDGVGFDVDAVRSAGLSVGLRSMEARAQRMGAQFSASSRPEATVLELVLPLS